MGFFNFFRKKQRETSSEKIKINEIENWIQEKEKQTRTEEENLLNLIKNKILRLSEELEKEKTILEKVNVDGIKAEERFKLITKENLNNYIVYLKSLIEDLKNSEKEKAVNCLIERIEKIFSDFEKRSLMSFQKATLLVGKELENIRNSIGLFSREFKNILEENKKFIENSKIFDLAKEKAGKISKIEEMKEQIKNSISGIEKSISSFEDETKVLSKDIEKIKKSKEYEEEKDKEERIERDKTKLKKEIYSLRDMINLKLLAEKFHSDEKKMQVIRHYKDNFLEAFEKESGVEILVLLNEAKINKEEISEKIKSIIEKKNEIENIPVIIISKNKIQELEAEARKIASEIENLNSEKSREEKKIEKLEKAKQDIINLIKENLAKINVEIE